MGKTYGQLSLEERCEIARLRAEGASIRTIATDLTLKRPGGCNRRHTDTCIAEILSAGSGAGREVADR